MGQDQYQDPYQDRDEYYDVNGQPISEEEYKRLNNVGVPSAEANARLPELSYKESGLPPTPVVEAPVNYRDLLYKKLTAMANKDTSADAQAMADAQNAAASSQAQLLMLEGATNIGRAGLNQDLAKGAFAGAQDLAKQQLNDYLTKRKAERDAEYDKLQNVKALVDLEQLQAKSDAAQKAGLTPRRVETWIGEKGEPLYEIPGKPGFVTSNLQPYTGKPKSFKQEGVNIQLGGLEERKKSGERAEQRFAWNKETKLIDRVGDLGKELNKAGESQYTMYRDDVLSNMKSAESAYGPLDSIAPAWILKPEGEKFRGAVARLIAPLRKDLFGATLTTNEQSAFDTMVGTGKGMSIAAFKHAINKLIAAKDHQINSIKSYDPDATQVYEQQRSGGFVKAPESGAAPDQTVKKKRKFNPATGQWET